MEGNELLSVLVGAELASVVFVRDYLQLTFDGSTLNIYTAPRLTIGDTTLDWSEPGFRDALCGRISQSVCISEVTGQRDISIGFADGAVLTVPLKDPSGQLVEAAMLSNHRSNQWMVWNAE